MRIFSSAPYCLRVARRMFLMTCSAGAFPVPDFCLIFAPLKGYDEPEILRSQLSQFGPISADAGQPRKWCRLPPCVRRGGTAEDERGEGLRSVGRSALLQTLRVRTGPEVTLRWSAARIFYGTSLRVSDARRLSCLPPGL